MTGDSRSLRPCIARTQPAATTKRHPDLSPKRAEIWAALAIVYVVWGSTYVGIKLAVRTLPPVLTAEEVSTHSGTNWLTSSGL